MGTVLDIQLTGNFSLNIVARTDVIAICFCDGYKLCALESVGNGAYSFRKSSRGDETEKAYVWRSKNEKTEVERFSRVLKPHLICKVTFITFSYRRDINVLGV